MNRYSEIIRQIAAKHNLPLVDLRKQFLDYNLKNNPENKESGILTSDSVHLNEKGNQLVADLMWSAIKGIKVNECLNRSHEIIILLSFLDQ